MKELYERVLALRGLGYKYDDVTEMTGVTSNTVNKVVSMNNMGFDNLRDFTRFYRFQNHHSEIAYLNSLARRKGYISPHAENVCKASTKPFEEFLDESAFVQGYDNLSTYFLHFEHICEVTDFFKETTGTEIVHQAHRQDKFEYDLQFMDPDLLPELEVSQTKLDEYDVTNINDALERLPNRRSEMIYRLFFLEQSPVEITKTYNISRAAVSLSKVLGLKDMRTFLTEIYSVDDLEELLSDSYR
ncbi:MAG: DNA-directed RNA polymerase specialized sigma24 family protein [Patescibacteria group bacterium]|jgi:DNA-directed RNA polymerase specialized sigma24 family protein